MVDTFWLIYLNDDGNSLYYHFVVAIAFVLVHVHFSS